MQTKLEVKVNLTRDDYLHFTQLIKNRNPLVQKARKLLKPLLYLLLVLVGLFLLFGLLLTLIEGNMNWMLELVQDDLLKNMLIILGTLVFVLIIIKIVIELMKKQIRKIPSEKSDTLKECTVRISTEGINSETKNSQSFIKWSGIIEIFRDAEYIYLFLDRNKAQVIPKRSFQNSQEADSFYNIAMDFWKSKGN